MMIATWTGTEPCSSTGGWAGSVVIAMAPSPPCPASDVHDLFFLRRQVLVDLCDRLVGRLLDLAGLAVEVVLADVVVLLELLQEVEPVAADMACGDSRLLGIFVCDL